MALTQFEKNMQIIQALDDEPNDVGGLTAAELKAKYDEGGEAVKAFLNDVLLPALDAYIARTDNPHAVTKEQVGLGLADNTADANKPVSGPQQAALQSVVLGQIPDASLTMAKMAADVIAELAGKVDAESALKSTGDNPTNFKLNQVARIINEDARFPVNYGTYVCARSSKDNTGGCYALHLYYGGDYLWFQQTSELNEITLAGWHKLTTATPPTEFNLPLESGISEMFPGEVACIFRKNQFSEVLVIADLELATPGVANDFTTVATLPAGYRPQKQVRKEATVLDDSGAYPAIVAVFTSGEIKIHAGHTYTQALFEVVF